MGEGAGWSNVAGRGPASHKDRGCTIRGKKRLRQASAPGGPRGAKARPGGRRAWEDGEGGVGCRKRAAGRAGKPRSTGPSRCKAPGPAGRGSGDSRCRAG